MRNRLYCASFYYIQFYYNSVVLCYQANLLSIIPSKYVQSARTALWSQYSNPDKGRDNPRMGKTDLEHTKECTPLCLGKPDEIVKLAHTILGKGRLFLFSIPTI